MTDPSTGGIQVEPGNTGMVYPSRWENIGLKKTTGADSTRLSQNLFLNIAVLCPACSPCWWTACSSSAACACSSGIACP